MQMCICPLYVNDSNSISNFDFFAENKKLTERKTLMRKFERANINYKKTKAKISLFIYIDVYSGNIKN